MCMKSYLIIKAKYKEATMVNAPDLVDQDLSLCWSCLLCKILLLSFLLRSAIELNIIINRY